MIPNPITIAIMNLQNQPLRLTQFNKSTFVHDEWQHEILLTFHKQAQYLLKAVCRASAAANAISDTIWPEWAVLWYSSPIDTPTQEERNTCK